MDDDLSDKIEPGSVVDGLGSVGIEKTEPGREAINNGGGGGGDGGGFFDAGVGGGKLSFSS